MRGYIRGCDLPILRAKGLLCEGVLEVINVNKAIYRPLLNNLSFIVEVVFYASLNVPDVHGTLFVKYLIWLHQLIWAQFMRVLIPIEIVSSKYITPEGFKIER